MAVQHLLVDLSAGRRDDRWGTPGHAFLGSRDSRTPLLPSCGGAAPMVWSVCRRLLHNHHDAEDAFQATFLVLVRKAAGVPRRAVADWIYGVARQTAVRLRATAAKRGRRETQVVNMPEPTTPEVRDADWQAVLDEELSRLPDHYRGVIVLCDLEGMTRKEAARQLGIPEGSVASRLARARAMLARRLTQRGVALSGGALVAVLSQKVGSAGVPLSVVESTIAAASLVSAGKAASGAISVKVGALTEGVMKAMLFNKLKSALVVVLILGILATGATILTCRTAAGHDDKKPAAETPVEPAAKQEKEKDKEAFTAWGKEINGLQAGLGFRPGQKRAYHQGEAVGLVLRVRNVGKEAVEFKHIYAFFLENPPTITDADGKTVELLKLAAEGRQMPRSTNVAPGKEVELYEWSFDLQPKGATSKNPLTIRETGKFSVQCERVVGPTMANPNHPNPTLDKLATGKLELEIKSDPPPAAKKDQEDGKRRPMTKEEPDQTDQERMVGNWYIVNDDSGRKGEMWVIDEDRILMHAKESSPITRHYFHRLDASKTPKQIDITVKKVNGPTIGIIRGIYSLDGDELRLCLAPMDKERPTAFPEKPGSGEVLILQRNPPTTPKNAKQERKVLTPDEAIKQMPKENVTVQFKVASVEWDLTHVYSGYPGSAYTHLKDGGKFTASLICNKFAIRWDADQIKKLGIETVEDFKGKMVRVTGRVEHFGDTFVMWVRDLKNIEVVKE